MEHAVFDEMTAQAERLRLELETVAREGYAVRRRFSAQNPIEIEYRHSEQESECAVSG
jgi:hypothetical protein